MIDKDIIKIASNTKNIGLNNQYNFKGTAKNSFCGDKITLEIKTINSRVTSMRYEINACIYCEASASLLSNKIKNLEIKDIKKRFLDLKKFSRKKDFKLPKKLSAFKKLLCSDNISRYKCVILPFDAVLKALK